MDLFDYAEQHRDGSTYVAALDLDRLAGQHKRILSLMLDGEWRTLAEIEQATGDPQASISARLRDFRKERFGKLTVNRKRISPGTFAYQVQR